MTSRILVIVLALSAAACSPIVRQTREYADGLRAQGKLVDAEAAYANKMKGVVTAREYSKLRDLRCDVRMEIARDELAQLEGKGTFEDVARLHEYVRRCANFQDVDNEITNFGLQLVERTFVEQVEPLWQAGKRYEALDLAIAGSRHLPAEHPRQDWIVEHRAKLAAPYAAGNAKYKQQFPLTAAVFGRLHNNTGVPQKLEANIESVAERQLAVTRPDSVAVNVQGECAGYMPKSPIVSGVNRDGAPYSLTAVTANSCATDVKIYDDIEYYEVPVEKLQTVTKRVPVTRPVVSKSTTVTKSCRSTSFGTVCDTIGSETRTYTRNETTYETVSVQERVTVMEQRSRPIRKSVATMTANVSVQVAAFGYSRSTNGQATATSGEQIFPDGTTDAQIRQYMTNMNLANQLRGNVPTVASRLADGVARDARALQLAAQSVQAQEAGNVDLARELALVAWVGGAKSSGPGLFDLFGVPIASVRPDALPALGPSEAFDTTVVADVFEQDPLDSFFEGIIVRGYPTNVFTFGGGHRAPETGLTAQPDRAALDAMMDTEFRWSLMTGEYHRGLGLLVGGDMGLSIGKRLGDDYERLVPLPIYVDEEDAKELGVTLGMRFSAQAMVGFRSYFVSLFGGFRPSYTNFSIGHFFSEGGTLPVAGRLELRLQERYPIIVEGWYGHFGKADKDHIGGTILLPLKPSTGGSGGLWLRARFDQLRLPAEIPGLFEKDDIYVPAVTTTSGLLAIGYAF